MKATIKFEPDCVFMIELSRKLRNNWTSGASSEPYVAVAMRHFGAPGAEINTPRLTLLVSEPLVPVTERVKDPVEAEDEALAVSIEVAGVPDVGVTGPGRLTDTPEGADPNQE